ncbi:PP2C family protein-serine/threonine phosphatase [Longispora urticae]
MTVDHLSRELRAAAPHALLSTLAAALRGHYDIELFALLMADYGLTVLRPVGQPLDATEPVPLSTTAAGAAFTSQTPVADAHTFYMPVTVRGDRLGVLVLKCASPPDTTTVAELAAIATALGHEIIVAERDTDLYLQARRRKRLTLAAEMQWQLLPGRACSRQEYSIGAQLEPAYAVGADNFDWSTDGSHLTVTVSNGMGEGMEGALLTNLAVNALRNARRAGVGLIDQAALADQAIYAQYGGRLHIATLLLRFDLATGDVAAIDAGSPRMLRLRDGEVEHVTFEAQLPLGMFDGTHYTQQHFRALPGDRYVIVSDGVHAARSNGGEEYGTTALHNAIHTTHNQPAPEAARTILRELGEYTQLTDDAIVFCLDWHGRDS